MASHLPQVIIEHPNYIAAADQYKRTMKDPFFRTDEKSQFSPDITPLILAAHHNNHEIIQMFLYRNHTIERPHPIYCQCNDCVTKQNYDSLKRSRCFLGLLSILQLHLKPLSFMLPCCRTSTEMPSFYDSIKALKQPFPVQTSSFF